MDFIPQSPKQEIEVPYFDDVKAEEGWQGQTTGKSLERLKAEIREAIERLGANVLEFQHGTNHTEKKYIRAGYRITYFIKSPNGPMQGQIDIAALPVRESYRMRTSFEKRKEQSLKMSLFMLRDALNGTWFLQQLSPGYSALVPFMLSNNGKTLSQIWTESSTMTNLLLPPGEDFVEGEITNGN